MVTIVFLISTQNPKIASKAALDAGAATDTNGNGSTAGNGVHDIQVTYTPRNGATAHVEVIHLTVSAMADRTLTNVDLTTEADAKRSIEVLDKALGEMGADQANLGALQNRMQYTINNLTQAAMNIEMARGRITDADFATESTVLAKHQILAQAATSMLSPRQTNLNSLSSACCNKQLSRLFDTGEHKSAPFFIFFNSLTKTKAHNN